MEDVFAFETAEALQQETLPTALREDGKNQSSETDDS